MNKGIVDYHEGADHEHEYAPHPDKDIWFCAICGLELEEDESGV